MLLPLLFACTRGAPETGDSQVDDSGTADLSGQLLVSDLRGNQWFTADPVSGAVLDTFLLSSLEPDVCTGEENDLYCLLFQSRQHVAWDGTDEVLFTYSALDVSDGDDDSRTDLIARVYAVDRATHATRWRVDSLDFSQLENGADYCPYDQADPCHPGDELATKDYWACSLHMTHDVVVTDEDAVSIGLWLVDSRNSRMLHVTAPRDGTCAVVDTVIDDKVPEWDIYNSNNSMQTWSDDAGENMLMSIKNSVPGTDEAQMGAPGRGKIVLWRRDAGAGAGEEWHQAWEFPPRSTSEESFLNDPHGADTFQDADGHRFVVFAHSLGRSSADYGEGTGGSIGVWQVDDDVPVYIFDVLLPGPDALQFPRDVTPLPDGTWLLTDSGCLGDGCSYETADWVIRPPALVPSGLTGAWRADHSQQHFVPAEVIRGPMFPAANLLYSSAYIE